MVHLPHYHAPPRKAQEMPPNREDAKPKRVAKPARPKLATKMKNFVGGLRKTLARAVTVVEGMRIWRMR